MIAISRVFEWDMGHRVTNHKSLCKNPHGHRYILTVYVTGPLNNTDNDSAQGMVLDFGELKSLINQHVADVFDHSFMYWSKDPVMSAFADSNTDLKMVPVDFVPTAECIVQHIATILQDVFAKRLPDVTLAKLELNETPKCKAIWEA